MDCLADLKAVYMQNPALFHRVAEGQSLLGEDLKTGRAQSAGLGAWQPRAGHPVDDALIRDAVTCIARRMNTTPARLDSALWKRESDLARASKGSGDAASGNEKTARRPL